MDYYEKNKCIYCGDWFQCRDHVIPVSWQQVFRDYKKGKTVKCCHLCNNLAGDSVHFSPLSKAEYLIKRYQKKFKKILKLPDWSLEKINQLDYSLCSYVIHRQHLKRLIISKLKNLDRSSCGLDVEPLISFKNHEDAMKAIVMM